MDSPIRALEKFFVVRPLNRFITQTTFGGPESPDDEVGNCWAACIATMLGIKLEAIPDALRTEPNQDKRGKIYCDFLATFNLRPLTWNFEKYTDEMMTEFWASMGDVLTHVIGMSPRGDWRHGVVYRAGKLFHDPHPSGDGVVKVMEVEFWLPIDPMWRRPLQGK